MPVGYGADMIHADSSDDILQCKEMIGLSLM